ncbi:hypothetical protein FB379_102113 [Aeribacillus composti]|nr:hypothetical protein FB379_102113 [Aeribacillus composti]
MRNAVYAASSVFYTHKKQALQKLYILLKLV